jgi:hypothetical protein
MAHIGRINDPVDGVLIVVSTVGGSPHDMPHGLAGVGRCTHVDSWRGFVWMDENLPIGWLYV